MNMHVMLDLETWGTRPGSALRSIGAVTFDPDAGIVGSTFYRNIDKASCLAFGLTIDADTIAWWEKQSKESIEALEVDQRSIVHVVNDFNTWFAQVGGKYIWCHGANFDEPLWTAACRALAWPVPWKFWDVRCTRTIFAMADFDTKSLPRDGMHHNALDDAIHQARCVQHAMALVRTQLPHNKTRSEHSGTSS